MVKKTFYKKKYLQGESQMNTFRIGDTEFIGKVSISDSIIKVNGKADIMGEIYPVSIICRLE